jgi:tRNA threonylcarbamoyladenosine biosynthesis protein TsaE
MRLVVENIEELDNVARQILEIAGKKLIAFYGPMGSGKTTLIKRIGRQLGVSDEVNSPTFSIVNEYVTLNGESVFHFDFYRIKRLEEAYDIGYENYFYSGNLCLVEWPGLIEQLLPPSYVKVTIVVDPENETRYFSIDKITN